ncbi:MULTISPECIES: DUF1360 domain-containing protein [unclassified Bacillus (in: firmicutes)]|uniref:DUF1360 domain-containing protein n=1 Tax=unclassified Bacillus (in: firmicutes) TaxID=185979 RepID=UPI0008ED09C8|nr:MULTISPECIES: DUF1360 domain-containing protein [unclassified Bacillus (in: firmicutes)]SFA78337.1 Protein of unknown function [Bacillus sp. UNCCL13]SFQ68286.1 Protein of unknown function [Bacillus sp. cl95]
MILGLDINIIIIIGFATFRLTRLIVFDKIMDNVRAPFFDEIIEENDLGEKEIYLIPKKSGIRHWIGQLLSCYWCVGIWVSTFLVFMYLIFPTLGGLLIIIMAVAGIGSIIETAIGKMLP